MTDRANPSMANLRWLLPEVRLALARPAATRLVASHGPVAAGDRPDATRLRIVPSIVLAQRPNPPAA
jgi:hypothetical protein